MVKNENFIELTDFLHGEFQKIFTTYGPQVLPKRFLNSLTNSVLKRYGLINKLENKKLKYNIAVDYAIFTMPHNFIWKMFHPRLWQRVKIEISKSKEDNSEEIENEDVAPEITVPSVVAKVDLDAMSYLSTLEHK